MEVAESGTVIENQTEYRKVDVGAYARMCAASPMAEVVTARKSAPVIARPAEPGEAIVTYAGDGTAETTDVGREGHMVLTKADATGWAVLDENGHRNMWQVSHEAFLERYEKPDPITNLTQPKGRDMTFVKVYENVAFEAPWGEAQLIAAGGWLNVTDPTDVYGVSGQDFSDTYVVTAGPHRPDLSAVDATYLYRELRERMYDPASDVFAVTMFTREDVENSNMVLGLDMTEEDIDEYMELHADDILVSMDSKGFEYMEATMESSASREALARYAATQERLNSVLGEPGPHGIVTTAARDAEAPAKAPQTR